MYPTASRAGQAGVPGLAPVAPQPHAAVTGMAGAMPGTGAGASSSQSFGEGQSFLVSPPAISLPEGGGTVRGLGETFAANPVSGTGSITHQQANSLRINTSEQIMLIYEVRPEKLIPEIKTAITQRMTFAIFSLIIKTKQHFGNIHTCTP
jgi:hypothetical protein